MFSTKFSTLHLQHLLHYQSNRHVQMSIAGSLAFDVSSFFGSQIEYIGARDYSTTIVCRWATSRTLLLDDLSITHDSIIDDSREITGWSLLLLMMMIRTNGDLARRHHHHHRPRRRRWSDCWEGGKSIFFSSFSSFPAEERTSVHQKMLIDSNDCHLISESAWLAHTYSWGKKQSSKKRTYISIKDRLYARASDESWCSNVTTHVEGRELCERQRARGRERDGNCTNDCWYWHREKAILCKSLGEKEKESERKRSENVFLLLLFSSPR